MGPWRCRAASWQRDLWIIEKYPYFYLERNDGDLIEHQPGRLVENRAQIWEVIEAPLRKL